MQTMHTNRYRWRSIATVALSATLLLACSSDPASSPVSSIERPEQPVEGPAPEEPAPEEPAPEEPAPEEPAPEEPAPEEPVDEESESLTTEEWVLVILLGFLVLAAVAGIVALFSRGSKGQSADTASKQLILDDITRTCRSVHDTSVISLLQATDSITLQSGWGAAQRQLVDLEGRISSLAVDIADPANLRSVQELGAAVTGVRGALESNVGLRSDAAAFDQADLIEASNRTVLYRSEQLESALQRALYLRL